MKQVQTKVTCSTQAFHCLQQARGVARDQEGADKHLHFSLAEAHQVELTKETMDNQPLQKLQFKKNLWAKNGTFSC